MHVNYIPAGTPEIHWQSHEVCRPFNVIEEYDVPTPYGNASATGNLSSDPPLWFCKKIIIYKDGDRHYVLRADDTKEYLTPQQEDEAVPLVDITPPPMKK